MSFSINFIDEDYDEDRAQDISFWLTDISEEYVKSSYYKQLSDQEKEDCFFLLDLLFDFAYAYCLVGPGKLNTGVLSELMLDVMPRKISANKETFESFDKVFNHFMLWCEEKNHIKNIGDICKFVTDNTPKMVKASQAPSTWGFAKALMMGREIETLLPDVQSAITVKRDKPKMGRNDSCTCGSGKKYKKCCMITGVH